MTKKQLIKSIKKARKIIAKLTRNAGSSPACPFENLISTSLQLDSGGGVQSVLAKSRRLVTSLLSIV